MSDYFTFSLVLVDRRHLYKMFVPRTVVNTSKHYCCERVVLLSHGIIQTVHWLSALRR